MSDYFVSIGEKEFRVKVDGSKIYLNGKIMDLKMAPLNGSGLHLLYRERKARELQINAGSPGQFLVNIGGRQLQASIETGHYKAAKKNLSQSRNEELRAPIPGLVVGVQVKEGEAVKQGQSLIILESMKMQMHIRASRDGQVKDLNITPGEQVDKDQVLVRVV